MLRFACTVGIIVLMVVSVLAAEPEKKSVKQSKQWTGSVNDEALKNDIPAVITDAKALGKLWNAWKVPGKVPKVDFAKELVVTSTTSGSRLNLMPRLDTKGNLELLGMATMDFGPGFRYVIAIISREGIKTVDGKKL